ncbi:PIN domain-containing protein [Saccharopolyspora karakumensis]|uniref:hypothetical protein n=1 Tax=Saccharopolyspora karakumensis TaxID=2530386 RepID=UPI001A9F2440|nr:hypothetical protein [Saccharopolyspora karakumensis]
MPLSEIGERVWELRHALSAYDAAYLVATEHLGGTLLSADAALLEDPDRRGAVANPQPESLHDHDRRWISGTDADLDRWSGLRSGSLNHC